MLFLLVIPGEELAHFENHLFLAFADSIIRNLAFGIVGQEKLGRNGIKLAAQERKRFGGCPFFAVFEFIDESLGSARPEGELELRDFFSVPENADVIAENVRDIVRCVHILMG
jgi:hypothetical protein